MNGRKRSGGDGRALEPRTLVDGQPLHGGALSMSRMTWPVEALPVCAVFLAVGVISGLGGG